MPETIFKQFSAGQDRDFSCWEAGTGETIVAIVDSDGCPTLAHALLAEDRRVIVFAIMTDVGTPNEAAHRIGAAIAQLAVARFDLMGEGAGAAVALWLALSRHAEIGSVVLAAPDGPTDEVFREINRPVLVLSGTKDSSDARDRYRVLLPEGHFMFVYDAGCAIGVERPEALAFIVREFFERRSLFLVSRENGKVFP